MANIKANYNIDRTGNGDFDTYYFSTSADVVKILADNNIASDNVLLGLKEVLNRAFFNADDLSKLKVYKYTMNHSGQKTVQVPLPSFDKNLDTIVLFLNSTIMIKGKDYTLAQTAGNIATVTYTNVPLGEVDYLIIKNLIPSTNPSASKLLQNKVNACISYEITSSAFTAGATAYEVPIANFDIVKDFLMVSANSVMYSIGDEYTLNYRNSKWYIDFTRAREAGETVDLICFKNVFYGTKSITSDGSVVDDVRVFLETNADTTWVRKFDVTVTGSNKLTLQIPDLKFNKYNDSSLIFANSVFLIENKDYRVVQRNNGIATFEFMEEMPLGRKLEILIFKNIYNTKDVEIDFNFIDDNIIPSTKVSNVGDLTLLETENKILVNSINELFTLINNLQSVSQDSIGDVNALQTQSKVIVDAINEILTSQSTIDYVNNMLATKVDIVEGKGLSTNDYTTLEKDKLASLQNYTHPEGVNIRHVSDTQITTWNNKSELALGETATTAYRGDRGKLAYDHSISAHAPIDAQKNSDVTKAEIEAKLTGAISTHTHPAANITESTTKKFVTDAQIANWNTAFTSISTIYTARPSTRPIGTMWLE